MNWGTKLIIGMGLFMSFIIVLVVKMIYSSDDALVENNYYEKGQSYNTEYNAKARAVQDKVLPAIEVTPDGLTISFEDKAHYKLVCKRPSDAAMDKVFEGDTDENYSVNIPKSQLGKGPWQLHLEFSISDVNYLVEKEIIFQ